MMINEHNLTRYLLDYVDDELSETEQEQLLAYLAAHPEMAEELQWLQKTKPEAEEVVFPGKALLYRSEKAQKKALIVPWKKVAVALAAAACLFLVFRIYQHPETPRLPVPQKLTGTSAPQTAPSGETQRPGQKDQPPASATEEPAPKAEDHSTPGGLLAEQAGESQKPDPVPQENTAAAPNDNPPAPAPEPPAAALAKIDIPPVAPDEGEENQAPLPRPAQPDLSGTAQVVAAEEPTRIAAHNSGGGTTTITGALQKLSDQKNSLDSSFTDKLFALHEKIAHPIKLLNIQKIKIGRVSFVFNKK